MQVSEFLEICNLIWRDSIGEGKRSKALWKVLILFKGIGSSERRRCTRTSVFQSGVIMADWDGWMSQTGGKPRKDEDFDEEDVWDVDDKRHESNPEPWRSYHEFSGSSFAWRDHTAPKAIPRSNTAGSHESKLTRRSSEPQVIIPDRSKIYGKKNAKMSSWYPKGDGVNSSENNADDEDDGDCESDVLPPHEWIARKLSRSQISSFSVCEGVGRTLKGRDLSKMRNAILTKTGFIE